MTQAAVLAQLGNTPLGMRNMVINGAMQISQRGTSFTSLSSGSTFTVDRMQCQTNNLGTWTCSQSTDAPAGFSNSLKWECTTADSSPAADDFARLNYRMEGQTLQHLKKGTATALTTTVSFWVKSSKTGTYVVEFIDADNSRHLSKSYTINSANTWEKKTLVYVGDTTGAFVNDNNLSGYLGFFLGSGTTYTSGTLNDSAWAAVTNGNRCPGQVNVADTVNATWYITGIQLEVGSIATEFEHRLYGAELALCQRYYHKAVGTNQMIGDAGIVPAGGYAYRMGYQFPVEMRTTPSFSYDSISFWDGQAVVTNVNLTSSFTNYQRFDSDWTSNTGLTTGRPVKFYTGGGTGYLAFSAEL